MSKIFENISWLVFDKFLRLCGGLLVGVWIARYLGPEQFGQLSFANALISIFGIIAGLGLQTIVVRDILRCPDNIGETLGTAAALHLLGGAVAYGLVLIAIYSLRPDDASIRALVAVLSSVMLFKASQISVYWFESQVSSRYVVWVQNGAFVLFAGVKVWLILKTAPLIVFAWATVAEAATVAVLLMVMLIVQKPELHNLSMSWERAKSLLENSWPLLISGIAVVVYNRIDQLMIGQILGEEAVGIYSIAASLSEVTFFFLIAIINSINPRLIALNKKDRLKFESTLVKTFRFISSTTLVIGATTYFLSEQVIEQLYGAAYSSSAGVLKILGFCGFFVGIGLLRTKYLVMYNLQIYQTIILILGALLNVTLNYFWIPLYGVIGAAWATFLTFFFISFLAPIAFPKMYGWRTVIYRAFSFA